MSSGLKSSTAVACALGLAATGFALAHGASGAGEPAAASAAAQTVAVEIGDADGVMAFRPDRLDVARGAAVRFVVHNAGALTHEFVIGDAAENAAHKAMMAQMPDMEHDDPNAKTLAPGATATLLWRFTHAGRFEFACLLPGHYEAGMHGEVVVK